MLTGASGFVGRALARSLTASGWEVHTLSRRGEPSPRHTVHDLREPLPDALREAAFDAVVHGASWVDEGLASFELIDANVRMSYHLTRFVEESRVPAAVHLSSIAVYGSPLREVTLAESSPTRPDTDYGRSKLLAEALWDSLPPALSVTQLRLAYVVGPDAPEQRVYRRFLRLLREDAPIRLVNPDTSRFCFVDVADVARLTRRALEEGVVGTFNVANDDWTSVREVLAAVRALVPDSQSAVSEEDDPTNALRARVDAAALRDAFGLAPGALNGFAACVRAYYGASA